jgi:hypothetical protein
VAVNKKRPSNAACKSTSKAASSPRGHK